MIIFLFGIIPAKDFFWQHMTFLKQVSSPGSCMRYSLRDYCSLPSLHFFSSFRAQLKHHFSRELFCLNQCIPHDSQFCQNSVCVSFIRFTTALSCVTLFTCYLPLPVIPKAPRDREVWFFPPASFVVTTAAFPPVRSCCL